MLLGERWGPSGWAGAALILASCLTAQLLGVEADGHGHAHGKEDDDDDDEKGSEEGAKLLPSAGGSGKQAKQAGKQADARG